MILFSYSTMLGWAQYGNRAVAYLFGKKGIRPYQVVYLVFIFWGCIGGGELVWNISDITNALMAVPNCIAVLGLSAASSHTELSTTSTRSIWTRSMNPIPQYDDK